MAFSPDGKKLAYTVTDSYIAYPIILPSVDQLKKLSDINGSFAKNEILELVDR